MRRLILASLTISTALAAQTPRRPPAARTTPLQGSLGERLRALLEQPPFDRTTWGVSVVDERGRPVFTHNAERMFQPASNAKLIVAAAAAALLPPGFRVRTSVYVQGTVRDGGVVDGDLVLYGRGDPSFSTRCYATDTLAAGVCDSAWTVMQALADSIVAHGVRQITGRVVGDGSYFEPTTVHPDWKAFDLEWWYAAPVSALAFNDNAIDFLITPAAAVGAPPAIVGWPDFGLWTLENRARTGPADSGSSVVDGFFRRPGTWEWYATGNAAVNRRPWTESVAVPDPNLFAARALAEALRRRGVSIGGGAAGTTDSLAFAAARRNAALVEHRGRPLADLLFPILNTSQNLFAEMLCKILGREIAGAGSWEGCLSVERRFLVDSVGVDSTAFDLADGSGLSASNLVAPTAFTQLLTFAARHPRGGPFQAALPHAGRAGSLSYRFRRTAVAGQVWAKTGSIARVNTLSGYVQRADGRRFTFSIMANGRTVAERLMLAQIDSLVVEIGKGR